MQQLIELEIEELHARIVARWRSDSFLNELQGYYMDEYGPDFYFSINYLNYIKIEYIQHESIIFLINHLSIYK